MRFFAAILVLLTLIGSAHAQSPSMIDNSTFTFDTTRVGPIGCTVDDVAPRTGGENKGIVIRCTPLGAQHVNWRNDAGVEIGTAANPARIDPTGTTAQPVSGTITANAGIGTFTTSDTSTLVDNAAFTDGTTRIGVSGFIFDEVAGTALTENDGAAARIDSKRAQVWVLEDNVTRGLRADLLDLTNNDALTVAIVDGAGTQITSFGGGTQYTEDAVAATDPVGTQPVMTRRDTPTALVSANLDVVSQQATNFGAAYVQIVTSGGAFVDTFGGSGGTAQADKSAFTEGTTNFTPMGGVFNETITADPTEDQAAAARITAKRAVHTNLRNASGAEIGVTASPLAASLTDGVGTANVTNSVQTVLDFGVVTRPLPGVDVATSTITASGQGAGILFSAGWGSASIQITGTWVGTIEFQGSTDGTNFDPIAVIPFGGGSPITSTTVNGQWFSPTGGLTRLRARSTAWTSGTATWTIQVFDSSLPAVATNNVKLSDGIDTALVTAAGELNVLATAQPGIDIGDVTLTAGTANIGDVDVLTLPNVAQTTAANLNAEVQGDAASGTAKSGNPVQMGGVFNTTQPTVTTGQVVETQSTARGATIVATGADAFVLGAGTANIGDVDVLTLPSVTIGTFPDNEPFNLAQVGGAATETGGIAGSIGVGGLTAQDVAVTGDPVLVAGSTETMADSAPTNRTTADGEVSRLSVTDGAVFAIAGCPQKWTYHENSSSALTDTTVHAAPSAGLSLYVESITFSTGAATAFNIFFEESTTTTILGPWYLEAINGRGATIVFPGGRKVTAATLLSVTTSAAIAHSIDVTGSICPG